MPRSEDYRAEILQAVSRMSIYRLRDLAIYIRERGWDQPEPEPDGTQNDPHERLS